MPVLVDLWAPWCGPCRAVAPALEELARTRAGSLRVVKVNVDEEPTVSGRLGVQGIPTMVLYHQGIEVGRLALHGAGQCEEQAGRQETAPAAALSTRPRNRAGKHGC